jgi:hypothetical protein
LKLLTSGENQLGVVRSMDAIVRTGLLIVEVLEDRALGILHYRRHQLKEPDVPSILE